MTYGNVLDSCLGPSFIFHGLQVRIDPYKEIWWILCCSVSKLFSPHPPSSRPKPRTYVFIFSGPAATRWDEFESLRFDVCLSCSRGVPRQSYSSSCCSPLVMFFPFFFSFFSFPPSPDDAIAQQCLLFSLKTNRVFTLFSLFRTFIYKAENKSYSPSNDRYKIYEFY